MKLGDLIDESDLIVFIYYDEWRNKGLHQYCLAEHFVTDYNLTNFGSFDAKNEGMVFF